VSLFQRFKESLTKTRTSIVEKMESLVRGRGKIDEDLYDELEELLILADLGGSTSAKLIEGLRAEVKLRKETDPNALRDILREQMSLMAGDELSPLAMAPIGQLTVIMVVGVNGVGKTTMIGKLAHLMRTDGLKVMLAAGDTFRAGAIEQLLQWGDRAGVEVIRHQTGSDPAAVIYDAIAAAKARRVDVLLCDTAGRLHTKSNLMDELNKVVRVVQREIPEAPHEVLLVLDATTGQNALVQAKLFMKTAGVTGLVLTKLDGTAKGGIVIAIRNELGLPVKYVGLGEQIDDLQPFQPASFIDALFATPADRTDTKIVE